MYTRSDSNPSRKTGTMGSWFEGTQKDYVQCPAVQETSSLVSEDCTAVATVELLLYCLCLNSSSSQCLLRLMVFYCKLDFFLGIFDREIFSKTDKKDIPFFIAHYRNGNYIHCDTFCCCILAYLRSNKISCIFLVGWMKQSKHLISLLCLMGELNIPDKRRILY